MTELFGSCVREILTVAKRHYFLLPLTLLNPRLAADNAKWTAPESNVCM